MTKRKLLILIILSMFFCCGCEKQDEHQIYFSPHQRNYVCLFNDGVLFRIEDCIYSFSLEEKILREVDIKELKLDNNSLLFTNGSKGLFYVATPQNYEKLSLITLSDSDTIENAEEIIMDKMDTVYQIVVSDNHCYYIKGVGEGQEIGGKTLKRFALENPNEHTTIYKWEDGWITEFFTSMHKYDQYLIMTYKRGSESLWVYDTSTQEMIISGNEDMAGATYYNGKLYYISESTGVVKAFDLKSQKPTENIIKIQYFVGGMTISCDESYIYLNNSTLTKEEDSSDNDSKIWVYDYEGTLVGEIDLRENADALESGLYDSPYICQYMCSTEQYTFLGAIRPQGTRIFYVDKSQIGSDNMTIHTLFVQEN